MKFFSIFFVTLFLSSNCFADKIKLLETNQEALQARVDLIQNAKSEILVEYYEVADDALSLTGLSLLRQAAERGVKVKILIDGLHNFLTNIDMAAMMTKNIEIKVYNPLRVVNPMHLIYRNHDKLLNIDGNTDDAYMIIGGRNAARNYFGKATDVNFKDADALVSGKSANESYKYFMLLWNENPEVKKVKIKPHSVDEVQNASDKITSYLDFFKAGNAWVKEEPISELLKDIEEVSDVHFVFNDPTKSMRHIDNKLSDQIGNSLLRNTFKSLTIVTPYLFPTDDELKVFESLALRGVKITIVTNSLASTDVVLVYAAFLTVRKRLADMGIELYLYRGPDTIHAKGAILDEKISFIGSFNLDKKSAEINREIGIRVGLDSNITTGFTNDFSQFINEKVIGNSFLAAKDKNEFSLEEFDSNVSAEKKKKLESSKKLVGPLKNLI